jgi:hypothetical protein
MPTTPSSTDALLGVSTRWLLFGVAVVVGVISGNTVNVEPLDWTYSGLLTLYADPGIPIASLAAGLGMGFVLGFIHLTSI